jgi:hypothetical protein
MIWDFKHGSIEDLLSLADDTIFRYSFGFESVIRLVVAFLSLPEIKIISQRFRMRKIVEPQKDPVTPKGFHNKNRRGCTKTGIPISI